MTAARFLIVLSAAIVLVLGALLAIGIFRERPYVKPLLLALAGFYCLVCVFALLFSLAGV
ncbi:hypothetical protein [Candidatus Solincola tengchongensis]|uniref:hypothetical protein n=1 Tax=Candidatus Solincola tengchongensis TaxID=2900693 RepID=UPI00257F8EE9|nr:hypothetical protein [Candidatus Solincola tengchongensis]